jgi:hypothetical protein
MAYSVINLSIYTAAYDGALTAIAASDRQIADTNAATYTASAAVAQAWAQALDTTVNNSGQADEVQVEISFDASYGFFASRQLSSTNITAQQASTWMPACAAILALITAAKTNFTNAGLTPNPWGGATGTTFIPVNIDLDLTALQALGAGLSATVDVITLPANARVTQAEIVTITPLEGVGLVSALTSMQASIDADGALVTGADGTTAGNYGLGLNPYPSRGGQTIQLDIELLGITGGFAGLTAGEITARFAYNISAS